jgi:hypothetical protein
VIVDVYAVSRLVCDRAYLDVLILLAALTRAACACEHAGLATFLSDVDTPTSFDRLTI